ncbi:unnamed protein product [Pneumocystis jirovecii]|uniref:Uncharacterized protein n=1 Tax=Pneumocystis jirovecii TaxID=42068 RepID=L0PHF7_PNEJI|nr:unnamed protein product [Pneumocystis jirovecii]
MNKSQKSSDISSDFDEHNVFSDEEYEISPQKKRSVRSATKQNKNNSTRITRHSSQNKEKNDEKHESEAQDKEETKKTSTRYSRHESMQNSLFIEKWADINGVNKALFETIDEVNEKSEWPLSYLEEEVYDVDLSRLNYWFRELDIFLKAIPSLKVYIGAHEPSKLHNFEPFSFYSLSKTYPLKTGYIIHTGFPIWGLDWCPGCLKGKQYLAISGHPDYETHSILLSTSKPKNSVIQIWSFIPGPNDKLTNQPLLEIFIFHFFGSVWDLKWCPLISKIDGKLGFLASIFSDGCARIFSIPLPNKIDKTLYMKLEKVKLSLKIYNTKCTCLCWISPNRIAVGASNGQICIFDLEKKKSKYSNYIILLS